jgi:hypothetical protein
MMNARLLILGLALALPAAAQDKQEPAAASLFIHAAGTEEGDQGKPAKLIGPEARLQVVVTGKTADGRIRDFTDAATYTAAPEGVVAVDSRGLVTPLKEGSVTLTASSGAAKATVPVTVQHYNDPPLINFPNQVTPIFTKLGCNGGGCHGKSGGQNGTAAATR